MNICHKGFFMLRHFFVTKQLINGRLFVFDGFQMGADTKEVARHKSVTLLRSPGVQHPLILALEIEKLSFLKACLLISAKNYFLLDFHRELANYRKIQISPLTNLHQFFFFFKFFSILTYFWPSLKRKRRLYLHFITKP